MSSAIYDAAARAATGDLHGATFHGGTDYESTKQRSMWIAAYTSLLVWQVLLLALYLFAGTRSRSDEIAAITAAGGQVNPKESVWADKCRRAVRAARTNFILVLSAVVVTALGFGPTAATVTLTWVAFALGALWLVAEFVTDSHWLRLVMSVLHFPLIAVVWGLAFRSRIS
ncbi:hypothetical protein AMAG_18641 [Allomyces macrogynus ATCC 38327]|uniref:Uncharacterized protein n=2 Tax=Allomyces macrogynus (strain ATCC 38327) TaxID=578462 RepID=A0A0L0SGD8_ALLM3|nr:hypothetical protein AMAG_18641 [Allomyces macrogynus ATCC 38327]|eukprot:KNE61499.1 hypothetical protein AMAG_18641 [Allomyces macrogynus ATCC 38327]